MPGFSDQDLDRWDIQGREFRHGDPSLIPEHARKVINEVCDAKLPWPLFFHGSAGSGKTCAARLLAEVNGGVYRETPEFVESCQRYKAAEGTRDFWIEWKKPRFAVLDEIGGRGHASDFEIEVVRLAINHRGDQPTLYVSNLSLDEINRAYDDRVASRLSGGTAVEFVGDRRMEIGGRFMLL